MMKRTQQGDLSPTLPTILHSPLPHSKTTCKTNLAKQLKEDARLLFQKSPRYNRINVLDPKAPSSNCSELTAGLTGRQSILMQLRTGHAQLNRHLHNIGATATPMQALICCYERERIENKATWSPQQRLEINSREMMNLPSRNWETLKRVSFKNSKLVT